MRTIGKERLRKALVRASGGCRLQGPRPGWPCGTCFFDISEKLDNADWQTVLLARGDNREDLDNLPADIPATLEKVLAIAEGKR